MRLAALKNSFKHNFKTDELFKLTEFLTTCLMGILTVATNENELVWKHLGCNAFKTNFKGLELSWDQPNNEPAFLFIASKYCIQDDGSGTYGFYELSNAIHKQAGRK